MSKKTPVSNKKVNNLFKYFSPTAGAKKTPDENGNLTAKSLKNSFSPSPTKKIKLEKNEPETDSKEPGKSDVPKSGKKEKKRQVESDHSEKENDDQEEEMVEGKRPRKKRRRVIIESDSEENNDFSGDSEPEYKPDAKEEQESEESEEEDDGEDEESPKKSMDVEEEDSDKEEKPVSKKVLKTTTSLYSLALKAGDAEDQAEEKTSDSPELQENVIHVHR